MPAISEPFKEGTIEISMYSNNTDLRCFLENIDFSRDDVRSQVEALTRSTEGNPDILAVIADMIQFSS